MKMNRNVLIIALGVITCIAWLAMTYDESGWGVGNFAGVVMIFGMIILPSIMEIRKKEKRKKSK